MNTTHESTAQDDQNRKRRLPPDLNQRTVVICNERDELKAEVQRLQAMVPNPAKARRDRTQDIEKLVLLALTNATLHAAVMAVHQCFRTGKVRDHLYAFKERYGIEKAPCKKKVKEILIKHGYVTCDHK